MYLKLFCFFKICKVISKMVPYGINYRVVSPYLAHTCLLPTLLYIHICTTLPSFYKYHHWGKHLAVSTHSHLQTQAILFNNRTIYPWKKILFTTQSFFLFKININYNSPHLQFRPDLPYKTHCAVSMATTNQTSRTKEKMFNLEKFLV